MRRAYAGAKLDRSKWDEWPSASLTRNSRKWQHSCIACSSYLVCMPNLHLIRPGGQEGRVVAKGDFAVLGVFGKRGADGGWLKGVKHENLTCSLARDADDPRCRLIDSSIR